jgi:hypothetical protein
MLSIRVVEDAAALAAHVSAWEDLAADALEAFRGSPPLLCGFFPLERVSSYRGLPVRHVRLWRYLHCFLGTPLVRRGYAGLCLRGLQEWLAHDPRGAAAVAS